MKLILYDKLQSALKYDKLLVQYDLKAPDTKRVKLTYDELLSSFAFHFNLRRYTKRPQYLADVYDEAAHPAVGRCRLTLSNPC
jgi:hypothetical protein